MYQDIWALDMWSGVSMTDAIINEPYQPTEAEELATWVPDTSITPDAALDVEYNRIYALPITARGSQLPTGTRSDRGVVRLSIPRIGEEEKVLNSEIMGVRETGTLNMKTLESVRAKKLRLIQARINISTEYLQFRSFDGWICDPATGVLVENLHVKFGTQQAFVNWDFSVGTTLDPNTQLGAMKSWVQDVLGNARFGVSGYILACGRNFYRALLALPIIKEAFNEHNAYVGTRIGTGDENFNFEFKLADNVIIRNVGNARFPGATNGFVNDNNAYLIPQSADLFRVIYGPSELSAYINNPLPMYMAQGPLGGPGFEEGLLMRAETFRAPYCARPDSIIKICGQNIVLANIAANIQFYPN